jgi:hypothetical protein
MFLCGCERPAPSDTKLPDVAEANKEEQERLGLDYLKKQEEKSAQKMAQLQQITVLRMLGPIAEWQVSTQKQGKTDEAIAKAKKEGVYDVELKKSFTDRGLVLKFFTYVPYAFRKLRGMEPQPESCDFICEIPPKWEPEIAALIGKPDGKTSDTDPSGKPRDWYRCADVSFAVVEGTVRVLRVHLDSKEMVWELIDPKA